MDPDQLLAFLDDLFDDDDMDVATAQAAAHWYQAAQQEISEDSRNQPTLSFCTRNHLRTVLFFKSLLH